MKKQLRLYDIYRTAITGERSSIRGIASYEVNKDATLLLVDYDNFLTEKHIVKNEDELRNAIKHINKLLHNCRKPGRKRK